VANSLPPEHPAPIRAEVAWLPIGTAVVAAVVALLATAARYGYHRDELYFLMLRPAWGYVDQPPLTPLLARGASALFSDTLWGMRVPAVMAVAAATVLTALITRELGGGRLAQGLSAWAFAFGGLPMVLGHVMLTATVDFALWAALLLVIARALLRQESRWWLVAGVLVGISTYNKLLIVLLLLGLLAGLLIVGPRHVFRSRWLWAGAGLALVIASPNLIYQATHNFPQLTMAGALSDNNAAEVRAQLLPFQFLLIAPTLAAVWIAGLVALLRRPQWRPVRAFAVAYPVALGLTFLTGGQIYYAFGLQAFLLAAGWVPTVDWMARGRTLARRSLVFGAAAVAAASSVFLALPVLPVQTFGRTVIPEINQAARDQVGWPEYVRTVADVYASLSPDERSRTILLASNYGEAGALARYGPEYGLPDVYSGHNQLWFEGPPPEGATTAVFWTQAPRLWIPVFDQCESRAVMDNGVGVDNEEQGSAVLVCRKPVGGWAGAWPKLLHYD
jgi:Dolichyl-phosphate-mannose-protein mannosyltransferase